MTLVGGQDTVVLTLIHTLEVLRKPQEKTIVPVGVVNIRIHGNG